MITHEFKTQRELKPSLINFTNTTLTLHKQRTKIKTFIFHYHANYN